MKFSILLKFGQRDHLESFRTLGECYMQSICHFRKLEKDEVRGDPLEGTRQIWQSYHIEQMIIGGSELDLKDLVRDLVGPMEIRGVDDHYCNLFCMYCLNRPTDLFPIDPRVRSFGDVFVMVTDTSEFLRRFETAARNAGLQRQAGLVTYFDVRKHSGETGTFRKSNSFEWQREYRFALYPGSVVAVKLLLGNLEDITTPVHQILELETTMDFTSAKAWQLGLSW